MEIGDGVAGRDRGVVGHWPSHWVPYPGSLAATTVTKDAKMLELNQLTKQQNWFGKNKNTSGVVY